MCTCYVVGTYVNMDGSISSGVYWAPGEPSQEDAQNKDCVYMDVQLGQQALFYTDYCDSEHMFLCKRCTFWRSNLQSTLMHLPWR